MGRYWYAYKTGATDPLAAGSYSKLTGKPSGCIGSGRICAIYSPAGSAFPVDFSQNLQNYITAALAGTTPQPQVPANAKYYVYVRS